MVPIDFDNPSNWRDLQRRVARILSECSLQAQTEKNIATARGPVEIDVFATDPSTKPDITYLCECKHWQKRVPKTVIHALRTVVSDYGPNWGFIISSSGFQSGAFNAVQNSNLRLLTWGEFQGLFVDRWIESYMIPRLHREADPLVDYTEPMNARVPCSGRTEPGGKEGVRRSSR